MWTTRHYPIVQLSATSGFFDLAPRLAVATVVVGATALELASSTLFVERLFLKETRKTPAPDLAEDQP